MPTPINLSDEIAQKFIAAFAIAGLGEEDVGEVDVVEDTLLGKLQDLMPPGFVWTRDPDARMTKLLLGLSHFHCYLHGQAVLTTMAMAITRVVLAGAGPDEIGKNMINR